IDIYDKVQGVQNGRANVIPNYVLTKKDILEWEQKNGQIPPKALVLLRTGWSKRWPNKYDYLGIPEEYQNKTNAGGADGASQGSLIDNEILKHLNFP
ncbi:unnamed protein product, partial [Allacma fusca]